MKRRALPTCNGALENVKKKLPKDAIKSLHNNLLQIDKDLDEKIQLSSFHDTMSEYAYAGGTGNNDFNTFQENNADVTSV